MRGQRSCPAHGSFIHLVLFLSDVDVGKDARPVSVCWAAFDTRKEYTLVLCPSRREVIKGQLEAKPCCHCLLHADSLSSRITLVLTVCCVIAWQIYRAKGGAPPLG